jgi:hypothetical protein
MSERELHKKKVLLQDGRYLIFYSFEPLHGGAGEQRPLAPDDASPPASPPPAGK